MSSIENYSVIMSQASLKVALVTSLPELAIPVYSMNDI